jgi:nucleotide-binding universal stress UspA family protein
MNDILTKAAVPGLSTLTRPFRLKRILLAHDGSQAAECALADATVLACRFHSEIIAARVHSTEDAPLDNLTESRHEGQYAETELKEVTDRLNARGLSCRGIVRTGAVGDTLFNLCIEENADLLMFGAYGCGSQDRHTLGSTAEHLLSALPCPAMVYGPSVKYSLGAKERGGRVLLPVPFPCSPAQVAEAIEIAKFFGVSIEILHVADTMLTVRRHQFEEECKRIVSLLENAGIKSAWSILYAQQPWTVINKRSIELASSFILMPLKYRHIMASDHVAARVIRESEGPVMTYSVSANT